jgi:hypothetical protein
MFSTQNKKYLKYIASLILVFLVSCNPEKKRLSIGLSEDAAVIKNQIIDFHRALKKAYDGFPMNTDSLMDSFFDRDVYYVTYWGVTEPIDSTKSRFHRALPFIRNYENHLENISVNVYDEGAYAFFILRQTYWLNGIMMDEYLPTTTILERRDNRWKVVHLQRSADFQTIRNLMEVARQRDDLGQAKH